MPNMFAHIELSTDDVNKAKKFYKTVFAWKLNDVTPGGQPYTMIDTGSKETGGGMMKKQMAQAPTSWLPYVQVEDVKKTMALATKAGAKVMVDYMPVGENMGAIGIFTDPTGATMGVWEASKTMKPATKATPKKTTKPATKAAPKKTMKVVATPAKPATPAKNKKR